MRYSCLVAPFCAVVSLLSAGCQRGVPPQPVANTPPPVAEVKLVIGEPIQVKNLTIFPIESSQARDADRFITLDEGTRAGTVSVRELGGLAGIGVGFAADEPMLPDAADDPFNPNPEAADSPAAETEPAADDTSPAGADDDPFHPGQSANSEPPADAEPPADTEPATDAEEVEITPEDADGPDVNRVVVVNNSDRPLYLMPGETIVGGQQDRVLAEETIIPTGGKPVTVAVYCVEHGRWSNRSAEDTSDLAIAYPVQDLVIGEGFAPGKASLNKGARLAVQDDKSQGRVWDEVAKVNESAKSTNPTDAFTSNFKGAEVADDLKPYVAGLENTVSQRPRIVGVIVAINGRVESMDVFESTPLFRKMWPKLIKGHALDAANAADELDPAEPERICPLAEAQKFYDEATRGEVASTKAKGELVMTGRASQGVVSFSVNENERPGHLNGAAGMGGMGMGGMGGMMGGMGGVHTSGFSK